MKAVLIALIVVVMAGTGAIAGKTANNSIEMHNAKIEKILDEAK